MELYDYWAKSQKGVSNKYHLFVYHSLESAACAHCLLESDKFLLNRLSCTSGLPENLVKSLIIFFCCLHDLGKLSLPFQALNPELWLLLFGEKQPLSSRYNHRYLGLMAFYQGILPILKSDDYLGNNSEIINDFLENLEPWIRAGFHHHGRPEEDPTQKKRNLYPKFFSEKEKIALNQLLDLALFVSKLKIQEKDISGKDHSESLAQSSWLFAGVVILCDWLASNEFFFPFVSQKTDLKVYWEKSKKQAKKALHKVGIMPALAASFKSVDLLFDYIKSPTPLQKWASCVDLPKGPKLFILEDTTGAGKTEAAMILTARILDMKEAQSFFIALPTMATANAMYSRMAGFYRKMFLPDANPSLVLAHSKRKLHREFQATIDAFSPNNSLTENKDGDSSAQCAAWFANSNKKALLASCGVGTVDQAVSAMMPLKHQALKVLGLSDSVLIIDEVHACDDYLAKLLCQGILPYLACLGSSVILLSATMPRQIKDQFTQAFLSGLDCEPGQITENHYPLATLAHASRIKSTPLATRKERKSCFTVSLTDEYEHVLNCLCHTANRNACACWVRNTVKDAVNAYYDLAAKLGPDRVMLFHARFAMCDRLSKEEQVIEHFGKTSDHELRKGRVLVATQVVEQSLDLDFDFMVSDLAPIDLVLQRAGRLFRHQRPKRPINQANLLVFSPNPNCEPSEDWYNVIFPQAAYVYQRHGLLWRTAHELSLLEKVHLPEDLRSLVDKVYDQDAFCPEGLLVWEEKSEGQSAADRQQAWFNALKWQEGYGMGLEFWSEETPTRLGQPTSQLVLLKWDGKKLCPWSNDQTWQGFELSKVSINRNKSASEYEWADSDLQDALSELRNQLGNKAKDCLLVPLSQTKDQNWQSFVLNSQKEDKKLFYSQITGLEV